MNNIDNILCILLLIFFILILLYLIYKKNLFCIKENYYNTNCRECPPCESIEKQKDFCDQAWMYDKNDPERVKQGKKKNCYNWKCYEDCYDKDCSITKNKSNTHDNTTESEDDITDKDDKDDKDNKPIISKYCDKYEKQIKSLEKYIKDLEAKNDEYNELEANCNELEANCNELEANCNNDELENELKQSKVTLEKYIKDLEAKNDELEANCNELEANCNELEANCNNNAKLQEKLSKKEQELINLKINYAKGWKDLSYRYNRLGSEINRIVNENRKLNTIILEKKNCNPRYRLH